MRKLAYLLAFTASNAFAGDCTQWQDGSVSCPGANPINGQSDNGFITAHDINGNQYSGWSDDGIAGRRVFVEPPAPSAPRIQTFDYDPAPAQSLDINALRQQYSNDNLHPTQGQFRNNGLPSYDAQFDEQRQRIAAEEAQYKMAIERERAARAAAVQESTSQNPYAQFAKPTPNAFDQFDAPQQTTVIPTVDLSRESGPDRAKVDADRRKPKCVFKPVMTDDEIALCKSR